MQGSVLKVESKDSSKSPGRHSCVKLAAIGRDRVLTPMSRFGTHIGHLSSAVVYVGSTRNNVIEC